MPEKSESAIPRVNERTLTVAEALCCISVDIDAVAGWLGSYGGEDSTSDISRGLMLSRTYKPLAH